MLVSVSVSVAEPLQPHPPFKGQKTHHHTFITSRQYPSDLLQKPVAFERRLVCLAFGAGLLTNIP